MKVTLMALLAGFCLVVGLPLAATAGPTPGGADGDGDGVENAFDNCTTVSNASQKDLDHDGCGDACDADADNNGITGANDFNNFRLTFNLSSGAPGYNPSYDMDCNGNIGAADFNAFRQEFNNAAGPSGITNSGRDPIACP